MILWPQNPEEVEEFHQCGKHDCETHGNWALGRGIEDGGIAKQQYSVLNKDLDPRQKKLIKKLTNGDYMSYLKGVRKKGAPRQPKLEKELDEISEMIESAPEFKKPVTLYRGYQFFDRNNKTLFNLSDEDRMKVIEAVAKKQFEKGDIVTDIGAGGPASSSLDPTVSSRFSTTTKEKGSIGSDLVQAGVIFEIEARKGVYIAPLAKVDHKSPDTGLTFDLRFQEEVLLSPSSKYRIKKIEKRKVRVKTPTGDFRVDENGNDLLVDQVFIKADQV